MLNNFPQCAIEMFLGFLNKTRHSFSTSHEGHSQKTPTEVHMVTESELHE